jgi:hypothetical protein
VPIAGADRPVIVRDGLAWPGKAVAEHAWLAPFAQVPEDAAPPLWMSPPPADAVGSYGAAAVDWIEHEQKIKLRWWQALAITRQLEHREDGSLCARTVVESAPRRAGKSVRVRGVALWRMAHPHLFGEVQTVIHTGSDVAICREIQRGAWRWAEESAGWVVSRANGKEALETPRGDRWLVRAQDAVYGYDVTLGVVDEAWKVKPDTVTEGLEPATLERLSPQLHVTSTAHRRATSLMPTMLRAGLTVPDPRVLVIVWAAPPDADSGDPAVWRAASPHWSEDRRRMIEDKYKQAMAGEVDPAADDPDPLAGFCAQYLNQWNLDPGPAPGERAIDAAAWEASADRTGTLDGMRSRVTVCIEVAEDLEHVTLVAAAQLDDGRTRGEPVAAWNSVEAARTSTPDQPSLYDLIKKIRPRYVGWFPTGPAAVLDVELTKAFPEDRGRVRGRRLMGTAQWVACQGLAEQVKAGRVLHPNDPLVNAHLLAAGKQHSGDGWRFVRRDAGHVDAAYAFAGAVHLARQIPRRRPAQIVTAA